MDYLRYNVQLCTLPPTAQTTHQGLLCQQICNMPVQMKTLLWRTTEQHKKITKKKLPF